MDYPLLHIKNLHAKYEQYEVLKGIDMKIPEGETICLLGKNGSGKSTLLKSIAGLVPIEKGEIFFDGRPIQSLQIQERINLGIGYLMQHNTIFPRLSISDHIQLTFQQNNRQSFSEIWNTINEIFPQLLQNKNQVAGRLSGGQRRFLGFAMLIAQGANRLWLLDEPSAGVSKNLLENITLFFNKYIIPNGITCLLVEQNLNFGKRLSSRQIDIELITK